MMSVFEKLIYGRLLSAALAFAFILTFASPVQASWIMRLINTPPDLLGAFVGLSPEDSPKASDQRGLALSTPIGNLPRGGLISTAHALTTPVRDFERSTHADYHAWSYTQPDATLVSSSATENIRRSLKVGRGQSFDTVFKKLGMSSADRKRALASIRKRYNPSRLQAGAKMDVILNANILPGEDGRLRDLYTKPDNLTTLRLELQNDGNFQCRTTEKKLKKTWVFAEAKVTKGSIYIDGKQANIPKRIIANTVRAFRHSMDLDRSLKKGDTFRVLFEATLDPDNRIIKSGELLYASATLRGNERSLYWYEGGSKSGFYYPSGRSQKQGSSLLQKPIAGGRLTSKFGMRWHPILKRRKMHRGVDYGAPYGTPVYAAGDGTVVYRGRKGAYGNFVEIQHTNTYSTAYAHLQKFASKAKKGRRVKKGQLIGYVGSTGRSTGPHLHYELRKNGKRINPFNASITKSLDLSGKSRTSFMAQRDKIRGYRKKAISNRVARLP